MSIQALEFSLTVPGVQLGDSVISASINDDLSDGSSNKAFIQGVVTAANTVTLRIWANEYTADDLNNKEVKLLLGRPNW